MSFVFLVRFVPKFQSLVLILLHDFTVLHTVTPLHFSFPFIDSWITFLLLKVWNRLCWLFVYVRRNFSKSVAGFISGCFFLSFLLYDLCHVFLITFFTIAVLIDEIFSFLTSSIHSTVWITNAIHLLPQL